MTGVENEVLDIDEGCSTLGVVPIVVVSFLGFRTSEVSLNFLDSETERWKTTKAQSEDHLRIFMARLTWLDFVFYLSAPIARLWFQHATWLGILPPCH